MQDTQPVMFGINVQPGTMYPYAIVLNVHVLNVMIEIRSLNMICPPMTHEFGSTELKELFTPKWKFWLQLTAAIDFHSMNKKIKWKSIAAINTYSFVFNETYAGLEQKKGE